MIGGVVGGSLALIALYALVQPAAAGRTGQATGVLVRGVQRAMSAGVAGIPNRGGGHPVASTPTTGPTVGPFASVTT